MNLTRQMEQLANVYTSVKPVIQTPYQSTSGEKGFSSTGNRNTNVLNELYHNITKKGKNLVLENVDEPGMGPEYRQSSREMEPIHSEGSREDLILQAIIDATNSAPSISPDEILDRVYIIIRDKTGKGLTPDEIDLVTTSVRNNQGQEDEIDTVKSDLNKDGKLSRYERSRGAAIDKAMGGSGELPKGQRVSEAAKSYSAKEAHKGKDIGKPGKQFKKIAKGAAKKYGSKKAGEKVAGAVLAKLRKEKFEFHGGKKNPNLMNATNYKPQKTKGFKPAGKSSKVASQTFLSAGKPAPKTPFIKNSGPESEGVELPQKPIEPSDSEKENYYEVNKFSQNRGRKINEKNINNDMSKSIFDRLYEDVMADDDAVALGATDAALDADNLGADLGEGEGEMGEDSGDVTITIPRDVAEHLHTILSDILGGGLEGEGEIGEEGELEGENEGEGEDEDNVMGEEIEAEEIGHPLVNQKKGTELSNVKGKSNVVDSVVSKLAKNGKGGDSKVTDKVGNDGDEGHPLVNQTKGTELSNVKGKGNVVKSTTSSKVGDTFFQSA